MTFANLNEDVLFSIIELLDAESCLNFANTCKYIKGFFKSYPLQKCMGKKVQQYLIKFLHDNFHADKNREFRVVHRLASCILLHISHMAHSYHAIKNANTLKQKMLAELLFKTTALPTTGIDIFPPVDTNQQTTINCWYCFEISQDQYMFLINSRHRDDWGKAKINSHKRAVSAVIHSPLSVEERCSYYAYEKNRICDWESIIGECCNLSKTPEPEAYLEIVAEQIKKLFPDSLDGDNSDNENKKALITSKLLYDLASYNSNPWEYSNEIDNGYDDDDLELKIMHSKETTRKSFDRFLFGTSYSKCFQKVSQEYIPYIKQFFDVFMGYLDIIPYQEFGICLTNFQKLFRPSELWHLCIPTPANLNPNSTASPLFTQHTPVVLDLFKRLALSECHCSNKQENYTLFLHSNTIVTWTYNTSFPFLNKLEINGKVVASYLFDRNKCAVPERYPPNDDDELMDDDELNERFQGLLQESTRFDLAQIKAVFMDYLEANFNPAPEATVNLISRFFCCLTDCPWFQVQLRTNNFWETF